MTRVRHRILDALVIIWTGFGISFVAMKWWKERQRRKALNEAFEILDDPEERETE